MPVISITWEKYDFRILFSPLHGAWPSHVGVHTLRLYRTHQVRGRPALRRPPTPTAQTLPHAQGADIGRAERWRDCPGCYRPIGRAALEGWPPRRRPGNGPSVAAGESRQGIFDRLCWKLSISGPPMTRTNLLGSFFVFFIFIRPAQNWDFLTRRSLGIQRTSLCAASAINMAERGSLLTPGGAFSAP